MSKLSFIVPVYRATATLERCIESVVYGDYKDIEIILIEDCSNDGSWELCKSIQNRFESVKCIKNEKNQGVSYTRNQGIAAAQGEYIAFVDSDDWVDNQYGQELLEAIEKTKSDLAISGFIYHNDAEQASPQCNLFSNDIGEKVSIQDQMIQFYQTWKLPQLWNKLFKNDMIQKNQIHFNEVISMGEDFEFILDYLSVMQNKEVAIVNKTLYHYIRATNTSLMSTFGEQPFDQSMERISKMLGLTGMSAQEQLVAYEDEKKKQAELFAYHILRSKGYSKQEKLDRLSPFADRETCRKVNAVIQIERIAQLIQNVGWHCKAVKSKTTYLKNCFRIKAAKSRLQASNITIISQNCIGGSFYHDMGMQFLSPTINLFFTAEDFMKFVLRLDHYLNCEMQMCWGDFYPIGILDDIVLHFSHYHTCREALESWDKRVLRIKRDRIFVIATDRDGFDTHTFSSWQKIKYPKVLFTVKDDFRQHEKVATFPEFVENGCIPDLIPFRGFYKQNVLIDLINQAYAQEK